MDQAIIYKWNSFELVNRMELFAENDYNFAGRPPLKCDFIYIPSGKKISMINLHMKCCDSGLVRRKRASKMLYDYIDNELQKDHKNYIILGDWNDDLKDADGEHCFDPFPILFQQISIQSIMFDNTCHHPVNNMSNYHYPTFAGH